MAYSDDDITAGMMAVIGSTGYAEAAEKLKEGGSDVTENTLRRWCKDVHAVKFEQLRERFGPMIEAQLANDLLDTARLASEVERLALRKAHEQLEAGNAREPAKIARDASQVKAQSVDKRLALQGRPTQITERRDIGEVIKALVGMKVVSIEHAELPPDATAASLRPPNVAPETPEHAQEALEAPERPQTSPSQPTELPAPLAVVTADDRAPVELVVEENIEAKRAATPASNPVVAI